MERAKKRKVGAPVFTQVPAESAEPPGGRATRARRPCRSRPTARCRRPGLAGEAIPPASRIVCVCDAFSAMTTDRSYRPGMPVDEALGELRRCAGEQFEPQVLDALHASLGRSAIVPRPALVAA